ncbi:putative leader peptide [Amycolatopsis sp. CFH S0740]|uniref:putative leader peptide n=1 Tax=Amycolatopsis sp. CFH S0740 TaxID=1644111 RepID=UPI003519BC23
MPRPASAVSGSPAEARWVSGTGTTSILPRRARVPARPCATRRKVRPPNDATPGAPSAAKPPIPSHQESERRERPGRSPAPCTSGTVSHRWSEPSPTIRTPLDDVRPAWQSEPVSPAGVLLVARRHVDLLRVASALCRPVR